MSDSISKAIEKDYIRNFADRAKDNKASQQENYKNLKKTIKQEKKALKELKDLKKEAETDGKGAVNLTEAIKKCKKVLERLEEQVEPCKKAAKKEKKKELEAKAEAKLAAKISKKADKAEDKALDEAAALEAAKQLEQCKAEAGKRSVDCDGKFPEPAVLEKVTDPRSRNRAINFNRPVVRCGKCGEIGIWNPQMSGYEHPPEFVEVEEKPAATPKAEEIPAREDDGQRQGDEDHEAADNIIEGLQQQVFELQRQLLNQKKAHRVDRTASVDVARAKNKKQTSGKKK